MLAMRTQINCSEENQPCFMSTCLLIHAFYPSSALLSTLPGAASVGNSVGATISAKDSSANNVARRSVGDVPSVAKPSCEMAEKGGVIGLWWPVIAACGK
jgi:hypothetical protein